MPRFRKIATVEAHQWFRNGDHPEDATIIRSEPTNGSFMSGGKIVDYYISPENGPKYCPQCGDSMRHHGWIKTLEGGYIVCPGDWILTGVHGEHYACKPDIFAKTYEEVKDA